MSAEESETVGPGDLRARQLARQADATEDLAESIERQNELLRQLIDVVAYGGGQ